MHETERRARAAIIRDILIKNWDPLGVFGATGAYNEYDEVVRALSPLLESKPSLDVLEDFLSEAAAQLTGLEADGVRSREAAGLLWSLAHGRAQNETANAAEKNDNSR